MRHRRVFCQGFDGRDVGESDCPSAERPASSDICDMGSCSANTWFFTEWSGQVMNYTFGLYFIFIHYFFVFFFLVFGRMRNWYPNAQGSLFLEQWNWLRRYQEARNIQDVRFGQRLQRQMVRRSLESGIKLILIINCVEHNRTNEKKHAFIFIVFSHVWWRIADSWGHLSDFHERPVPCRTGYAVLSAR